MDMAGFAVNFKLVYNYPNAQFSNDVQRGYQESVFLKGLGVSLSDLEPKADGCTKVRFVFSFIVILFFLNHNITFLTVNLTHTLVVTTLVTPAQFGILPLDFYKPKTSINPFTYKTFFY